MGQRIFLTDYDEQRFIVGNLIHFILIYFIQSAIELFVVFHHNVSDYLCFAGMFNRRGGWPLGEPNRFL